MSSKVDSILQMYMLIWIVIPTESPNDNSVLALERHKILFFGEKTSNLIVLLVFKEMQWILLVSFLACNSMKFRKKINVKEPDCARETKINKRF